MKKQKILLVVLVFSLIFTGVTLQPTQTVSARSYYDSFSSVSDSQKNDIHNMISSQSFSLISNQAALDYADHFMFQSNWKVGRNFPYRNNGSYARTISDGTYRYNVGSTKGCYAYCRFLQYVFFNGKSDTGTRKYSDSSSVTANGIQNLLKTNGQAGEHLRIDNYHSLTFLGANDDGFYALSYEGGPIRLVYFTWSNFAAKYRGYRVWLYNVDTAVNSETTSSASGSTTTDTSAPVISGVTTPTTLKKGSSWTCTGTITSVSPLYSVCGSIVDTSTNKTIYSYTDYVSTNSYKMSNSKIDRQLLFNKLDEGSYYYVITAVNNASSSTVYISDAIQVVASGKPVISNASAPSSLGKGKSWTCTGVVTSKIALQSVTGQILDASGNVVYTYTKNTTAKTYRMAGSIIDRRLYFNRLSQGTYYYRISATNASGTTVWTSNPITIQ
jgi:hypothetical protein